MNTPTHHHETDDPFARRLRSQLAAELSDLPEAGGPDAAVSRGRSRRRNRRAVLASAAVFAVVAASSQAFTGDPGEADLATAPDGIVVDESLTFDWTTTNDGLSSAHQYSAGDSGLYALSTAPGVRSEDAPRTMYRLADDGTWTPIALEGDDPRVSTLSERGGTLYALSTGPASGDDGGPTGSVSTDGGETWSSVPLETPAPPSDAVPWTVSYSTDIASTADHTIALVAAEMHVPYEHVFPELSSDGNYTYDQNDEGITLVRLDTSLDERELEEREDEERAVASGEAGNPAVADPDDIADPDGGPAPLATTPDGDGEVVRTVTWAELGISGPEDLLPRRWAYAADGDEWNETSTPSTGDANRSQFARLDTVGGRFLLSVEQYSDDEASTVDSYLSADGQDWATIDPPGAGELLAAGDSLLFVDHSGDGTIDLLQVSHDLGATWAPIDLRSLDPALESLSSDHYVFGYAGPLGVALLVDRSDEQPPLMLFSTDLEAWNITDLAEILPQGGYFGGVLIGTDRIAILGHTGEGEPGSPERSATLTGVPRRT